MTKEELKNDIYYELRDRFKHTTDPYRDIATFALNDFFADYVAKHSAGNRTLEEKKPTGYRCLRCGRDKFTSKQPHNCDTGFRKRNIIWRPKFD